MTLVYLDHRITVSSGRSGARQGPDGKEACSELFTAPPLCALRHLPPSVYLIIEEYKLDYKLLVGCDKNLHFCDFA